MQVVLSVRDSFDKWYDSAAATIASAAHWRQLHAKSWALPSYRKIPQMVWRSVWGNPRLFDGNFNDRESTRRVYDDWIAQVLLPRRLHTAPELRLWGSTYVGWHRRAKRSC